jgi:hypothetical protein
MGQRDRKVCQRRDLRRADFDWRRLRHVRWKRVAFWTALWWFVYTAPTEDPFARFRGDAMQEERAGVSAGTQGLPRHRNW